MKPEPTTYYRAYHKRGEGVVVDEGKFVSPTRAWKSTREEALKYLVDRSAKQLERTSKTLREALWADMAATNIYNDARAAAQKELDPYDR